MTHDDHHQHRHEHGHHGHEHQVHGQSRKGLHKDWRAWLVVGLMLAAMLAYVFSMDEALNPADADGEPVPAAAGP